MFQILICRGLHGDVLNEFSSTFSKRWRRSNARSVGRLRRGEISLSFQSATEGWMTSLWLGRGEPHTWGVPLFQENGRGASPRRSMFPFLYNAFLNRLPAFFFETRGAKKKAWQKRTRRKGSFASAEATNAPRVGSAPPFGKGGRKLILDIAVKSPTNQNLKPHPQKQKSGYSVYPENR